MIRAQIVAHSLSPQGDELISVLATFPRSILAEINTHRMLSKNTSSSRAIPFNKMIEAIENNPFIPMAWQKEHKGMQGKEYITNPFAIKYLEMLWLEARDLAVNKAKELNGIHGIALEHLTDFTKEETIGITKQITNRILEPYMWTTMLLTGSKEGWDNFFHLRCPAYTFHNPDEDIDDFVFKSKKDVLAYFGGDEAVTYDSGDIMLKDLPQIEWLKANYGQAEIHIMDLAEKIWDARNESTPKQLQPGEWHIPFADKFHQVYFDSESKEMKEIKGAIAVKVATSMAARTSYTVVGTEKEIDYEHLIGLHDKLLAQEPPHSSPMEHCAKAMSDLEYYSFVKGQVFTGTEAGNFIFNNEYYPIYDGVTNHLNGNRFGWVYNLKGFMPYRYLVDNKIDL